MRCIEDGAYTHVRKHTGAHTPFVVLFGACAPSRLCHSRRFSESGITFLSAYLQNWAVVPGFSADSTYLVVHGDTPAASNEGASASSGTFSSLRMRPQAA